MPIKEFTNSIQQLFYKVKNDEIEASEISLLDILEEYLQYIMLSKSKTIDLEIVADFLISISYLILWKSNLLLPVNQEQDDEDDEDDEFISNEKFWAEYKKYNALIKIFEDKEVKQSDIFLTYLDPKIDSKEKYQKNDFSDLILAIESVLSRKKENSTINIKKHEYNISQKIKEIEEKFKNNKGELSFYEIIETNCSRIEIIIVFLALLELICKGKVYYTQSENFGEITFYRSQKGR